MGLLRQRAWPAALLFSLVGFTGATEDFCCVASGRWQNTDVSDFCGLCSTSTDAARPPHWCGLSQHNCGQCSGGQATWCSSPGPATTLPVATTTTTSTTTFTETLSKVTKTFRPGLGKCQGPSIWTRSYVNILPVTEALLQCSIDCDADPSCKFYSYGDIDVYCYFYAECPGLSGSGQYRTFPRDATSPHPFDKGVCGGPPLAGTSYVNRLSIVDGFLQCRADCESNPACRYYSYSETDVYCWLHSECSSVDKEAVSAGYRVYSVSAERAWSSSFFPVTSAPRCSGSGPALPCNAPCGDSSDHGVRYSLCTAMRPAKRFLVTFTGAHHAGEGIMINALRLYSRWKQLDFIVLQVNGSEASDRVAETQRLQWYTHGAAWIKDGTEHTLLIELQREATVDRVHMWTASPRMTPKQVTLVPVDAPANPVLCAAQEVGWPSTRIDGDSLARVEVAPLAAATSRLLVEFSSTDVQVAAQLRLQSMRLYSKQAVVPFVVERMRTASGIATLPETSEIHFGPFEVSGFPVTLSILLQRPAQVEMVEVRNIATQPLVLKIAPLLECERADITTSRSMTTAGQAGRQLAESAFVLV